MSAALFGEVRSRARQAWDWLENPVLGREFRGRMRGSRSYVITGSYTLVVMVFVLGAYWFLAARESGEPMNQLAAEVGRGIWLWGCLAQALLLPLMVPAFTCGAITQERERESLELLLLTRQSPMQICLGKVGSGVGLGLMLVLSSVPVLALSLFLGGVAPGEIAACLAVLCSSVIAAGALGLAVSTVAPKTVTSTVFVYLVVGTWLIGLPILAVMARQAQMLSDSGSEAGILAMLALCTVAAFAPACCIAALLYGMWRHRLPAPPPRSWWMLTTGLSWAACLGFLYVPGVSALLLQSDGLLVLFHPVLAIWQLMQPEYGWGGTPLGPVWALCTFAYLGVAGWCFLLAVVRVRRLRAH